MKMNIAKVVELEDLMHSKFHPFQTRVRETTEGEGVTFLEIALKFKTDKEVDDCIKVLKSIKRGPEAGAG